MTAVTVIIAAYNAQATIERAVRSALAQPEAHEVIVVDDASQDGTSAIARSCDDGTGRLRVLLQSSNQGPAAARNLALALAQSPWISILDADDYLAADRLTLLLANGEDHDLIADDLTRVSAGGVTYPAWSISAPRNIDLAEFVRANISEAIAPRLELGFAKPLMRRSFLQQNSLCYADKMRLGEDFDLYARALALGARMTLRPAAGYFSVESDTSLSRNHTPHDLSQFHNAILGLARAHALTVEERAALKKLALSVNKRLQWRLLIEAVKKKDVVGGLSAFRSPSVAGHLCGRLVEQFWIRARRTHRAA